MICEKGRIFRIHFDHYPAESLNRFGFLSNDCLYRAKNHASWVVPTVDFDEFLYLKQPGVDRGHGNLWGSLLQRAGKNNSEVHSFVFSRFRFTPPPSNVELAISSCLREDSPWPQNKYVANVDIAFQVSIHEVTSQQTGTAMVSVNSNDGVIHHYRLPNDPQNGEVPQDIRAHVTDGSLAKDVELVEAAIQERFQLPSKDSLKSFLRDLADVRPPTVNEANSSLKKMTWSQETWDRSHLTGGTYEQAKWDAAAILENCDD
eukprot:s1211_g25.t1